MHRHLSFALLAALLLIWGCGQGDGQKGEGPGKEKGAIAKLKPDSPTAFVLGPDNTEIKFIGTKPEGKHEGGFKQFEGFIDLPDDPGKGQIALEIDTTSLWSDNPKLTQHLKSPDFFNVKTHPQASFVSTKIEGDKGEGKTHTITGDLTLLDKTKSVTVPAEISKTDDSLKVQATFTIDRTDFGMTYGQGKVDNEVKIFFNVNAKKK